MQKLDNQQYDYITEEVHNIQNQIRRKPQILIPTIELRLSQIKNNQYKTKDGSIVKTKEGKVALEECLEFLKRQQPLSPLIIIKKLNQVAHDHVNDMGGIGFSSHQGSDGSTLKNRIEKYGKWKSLLGESLSFGIYDPLEILIQLIIDDGVQGRGHRNNIFTAGFNVVGIAFGFHKKFGICGVLDYVGQFIETIKVLPTIQQESNQNNFLIPEEDYPSVTPFIQTENSEENKLDNSLNQESSVEVHQQQPEVPQKKIKENSSKNQKQKKNKIANIFQLDINNLRKQIPRKFSSHKSKMSSNDSQRLIIQDEKGSKAMSIRSKADGHSKDIYQNPEKNKTMSKTDSISNELLSEKLSKRMSNRSQTNSHSTEQFQIEKDNQQSLNQKSSLLMYFEQKIQEFESLSEINQNPVQNLEIQQISPKFSEFESQEGLDELIDALYLMIERK